MRPNAAKCGRMVTDADGAGGGRATFVAFILIHSIMQKVMVTEKVYATAEKGNPKEELEALDKDLKKLYQDLDQLDDRLDALNGEMSELDHDFDDLDQLLDEATDTLVAVATTLKEGLKMVVDEMKGGDR